jgi:cytochrome c oxidase cbb3-type subunit IV
MLKFIKHHLDTISGVEIYPIISLLLFFLVFMTMLIIVLKMPKKSIEEISKLPLDNDFKNNSHEQ